MRYRAASDLHKGIPPDPAANELVLAPPISLRVTPHSSPTLPCTSLQSIQGSRWHIPFSPRNPLPHSHSVTVCSALARCLAKPWSSPRHCDLYYRELAGSQGPSRSHTHTHTHAHTQRKLQKRSLPHFPSLGQPPALSPPLLAAAFAFGRKTSNFRVIWKSPPNISKPCGTWSWSQTKFNQPFFPPTRLPPAETHLIQWSPVNEVHLISLTRAQPHRKAHEKGGGGGKGMEPGLGQLPCSACF